MSSLHPIASVAVYWLANIAAVLILLAGVVFIGVLVFKFATSLWARVSGFRRWRAAFLGYLKHREGYEEYRANRGDFFLWQTTREGE